METLLDGFYCGNCRSNFDDLILFLDHKIQHTKAGSMIKCLLCSGWFVHSCSWRDHLLYTHSIQAEINEKGELIQDGVTLSLADNYESGNSSARCCPLVFSKYPKKDCTVSPSQCVLVDKDVNDDENKHGGELTKYTDTLSVLQQPVSENSNSSVDVITFEDSVSTNYKNSTKTVKEDTVNSKKVILHRSGLENKKEAEPSQVCLDIMGKSSSDLLEGSVTDTGTCDERSLASSDFAQVELCSKELLINDLGRSVDSSKSTTFILPLSLTPEGHERSENLVVGTNLSEENKFNITDLHAPTVKTQLDDQKENSAQLECQPLNENAKWLGDGTVANGLVSKAVSKNKEEDSNTGAVDFHFLLGTTSIKGNSMSYERTDFRCLHCTFSTAWRPSLVKHMKYVHKDTLQIHAILDIRNCDMSSDSSLSKDEKGTNTFQVMKMSEYLARNMKQNMSKRRKRNIEHQDIPGKYHCPICHKVFSRLRYIRRHQESHHTERPHLCDTCGKSFKTKATLVAHHRSHKTRSYCCPQCSFVSSNSAAVHHHRQLHPNGSVVCDICGTAYIDKSTLKKHRKVHDLNRPFPCTHPGCTWRFKTDVMRKAHVRAHTSQGKFRCHHCGYHFRQKHHLQRHITKIHPNCLSASPPCSVTASISSSSTTSLPLPSLSSPISTSLPFPAPHLSTGSDLLVTAANEAAEILKTDIKHDLLTSSVPDQHKVFTSPPNNLLCTVTDTAFSSGLIEPEQAMIEVLVGEKHDNLVGLEIEEEQLGNSDVPVSSLSNLEYITDSGDVVQLVRPGQTYMGQDQHGNLVQYKIADVRDPDEASHPIYFIGVDGSVVGTAKCQEQALLVTPTV